MEEYMIKNKPGLDCLSFQYLPQKMAVVSPALVHFFDRSEYACVWTIPSTLASLMVPTVLRAYLP